MNKKYFLFLIMLLFFCMGPFRPFGCKTTIEGIVINNEGDPAEGAIVSINIEGYEPVTAGADGKYKFENIPYGEYTLTIHYDDYPEDATKTISTSYLETGIACKLDGDVYLLKTAGYSLTNIISNSNVGSASVACDDDYIFITDPDAKKIKKFDYDGNLLTSESTPDWSPEGIVIKSGYVYVVVGDKIKKYDFDLTFQSEVDMNRYGSSLAIDGSGNYFVVPSDRESVVKYDSAGNKLFEFGELGFGDGEFLFVSDIALDSSNNIYVADQGNSGGTNSRFQVFDSNGNFVYSKKVQTRCEGRLNLDVYVKGIAIGKTGDHDSIYVTGSPHDFVIAESRWKEFIPAKIYSSGGGSKIAIAPSGKVVISCDNSINILSK